MIQAVDSASVFRHPQLDSSISDHFPVRVIFKSKFHPEVHKHVEINTSSIVIREKMPSSVIVSPNNDFVPRGEGEFRGSFASVQEAHAALDALRRSNPGLSYSLLASVKHAALQCGNSKGGQGIDMKQILIDVICQTSGKITVIVN